MEAAMHWREKRVLLREYLNQGWSKSELTGRLIEDVPVKHFRKSLTRIMHRLLMQMHYR
jgi:hypothetical protein